MLNKILHTFSLFIGFTYLSFATPANADEQNCTFLHEAAFLDEPREIEDLLASGVDINCTDMLGHTALVTAVNGASIDSFILLVQAGAKVNVRTEYGNSLLQHTKRKFRSVDQQTGLEQYRDLYKSMIARLQTAGAIN
ncbi:MAG: hypothetical protein OQK24_06800 [Magnetovibrio sp.]|nr:hypothetical protein [Magnetovibrio sp.]